MLNANFVILAAGFNVIGCASYIIEIIKGRAKPNRVSWLLWGLAPLIAFSAQITEGVGISSLMTFMVGFLPLTVFLASFINRKAYWQITRLDIACGLLSLAALALWAVTRKGDIAIALSIAADGLAAVPTILKSWKEPETEDYRVFLCATISTVITLLTLQEWKFAVYGFPVYILLLGVLLTGLIAFPRFRPVRTA
jgi:hypothetical protein